MSRRRRALSLFSRPFLRQWGGREIRRYSKGRLGCEYRMAKLKIEDQWRQAKIVVGYAGVLAVGVLVYYKTVVSKDNITIAAQLVEEARGLELKTGFYSTENETNSALRKSEEKCLKAIQILEYSLHASKNSENHPNPSPFTPEWLSNELTSKWYPLPGDEGAILPSRDSPETQALVRALKSLVRTKKMSGDIDYAESAQLRLLSTLRNSKGMGDVETIEASRELAWIYWNTEPSRPVDAIGVLERTLGLVRDIGTSREIRSELGATLCQDLAIIHRSQNRPHMSRKYSEEAIRLLESGSGGRNDPRCGSLWTAVTADWMTIGESISTSEKERKEAIDESYFAAKEAVRITRTTSMAYQVNAYICIYIYIYERNRVRERGREGERETEREKREEKEREKTEEKERE
ncbi:hypothetical protein AAMO2058_001320800 [Amorphochlora amoebiformis]